MNFHKVIQTIIEAFESNLEAVTLMLIVVSSLYVINILFGTFQGTKEEGFSIGKFFFGFEKMLLADAGLFAFSYVLNLFSLTLQITKDITISTELITTLEVIMMLYAWAIDLCKDIFDKLKSIKTLKWISYDDIKKQDNPQSEKGVG